MIRLLPLLLALSACTHIPTPSCANARAAQELARAAIERVCPMELR